MLTKRVYRNGNSACIILDKSLLKNLGVEVGDKVKLTATPNSITITKVGK